MTRQFFSYYKEYCSYPMQEQKNRRTKWLAEQLFMFAIHPNPSEKSSASEQEANCRSVAKKRKGLTVVCVYRDIEKYRVKNKLVEPSGTRSDRHSLLTMLRDASKGGFGTHRD